MAKKWIHIVLIALSGLILAGVGIAVRYRTLDQTVIEVDVRNGETQTIRFESLCLVPGEVCDYTLTLGSHVTGGLIELAFRDQAPEKMLKAFAFVRIEYGDRVICDARLDSVFTQGALQVELTGAEHGAVRISYYLPQDVGNEAQNAEADFELLVTAKNE